MAGYGDDNELRLYAEARGIVLPEGSLGAVRQIGSVYVDGVYGPRFPGQPTGGIEQERAWPRTGATAFGQALSPTLIPRRVVEASYEAAIAEHLAPGSLSIVVTPNKRIVEVKAGSAGVRYSDQGDAIEGAVPVLTVVEGLLAPLLIQSMPAVLVV